MIKIAMAGAQDTGKTTVARMLSGRLAEQGLLTHYVQEFARDYIPKAGMPTNLVEELFLIEQQIKREDETPESMEFMVTDSPVFLAYIYALLMVPPGPMVKKDIIMLGRIYDKLLDHGGYDYVFCLGIGWEAASDGVRPQELLEKNQEIDSLIRSYLDLHRIPHVRLTSLGCERQHVLRDYLNKAIEILCPEDNE